MKGPVAGLRSRGQLLADCDVILLPKPLPQDLADMREGQVLWGWRHCVQNEDITQLGVDWRLTVIAFEAMHHWPDYGSFPLHLFPEIRVRGKGGRDRTVKIDHEAARRVDRYLRVRAGHEQAYRLGLWPGTGGRG